MYEEDRVRVLELYDALFDESDNETAVLQLLVSPTRQAVNLARAYDAKDRSYQEEGSMPGYLQVIEQLRAQVRSLAPAAPRLDSDQLSLFEQASTQKDPLVDLGIREAEELTAECERRLAALKSDQILRQETEKTSEKRNAALGVL